MLNLTIPADVGTDSMNRLGKTIVDPKAYNATIVSFYMLPIAPGVATKAVIQLELDTGVMYYENIYLTNKNGETFYTYRDKKNLMPGLKILNQFSYIVSGVEGIQQTTVRIADPADASKSVESFSSLVGAKVLVGITKTCKNSSTKNDAGIYIDTAEKRFENAISVVCNTSGLTYEEVQLNQTEHTYLTAWVEKYTDKVIDKYKEVAEAAPAIGGSLLTNNTLAAPAPIQGLTPPVPPTTAAPAPIAPIAPAAPIAPPVVPAPAVAPVAAPFTIPGQLPK